MKVESGRLSQNDVPGSVARGGDWIREVVSGRDYHLVAECTQLYVHHIVRSHSDSAKNGTIRKLSCIGWEGLGRGILAFIEERDIESATASHRVVAKQRHFETMTPLNTYYSSSA